MTGMADLRTRDYARSIGQFLFRGTTIPNAAGTQGYNRYSFAAGNPASFTDPSGRNAAGDGWDWSQVVPPLLLMLGTVTTIGEFPVTESVILDIVFFLIGMWLDSHIPTPSSARAARAAGRARAALDRIGHGAGGSAELPRRVSDKIEGAR